MVVSDGGKPMTKAILFAAAVACANTAFAQVGGLNGGVVGSTGSSGSMSSFGSPGTFGSDTRSIGGDTPATEQRNGALAPATTRPAPAAPNAGSDTTAPVPGATPPVQGSSWGTAPADKPKQ
jgi:hypothetical protein